MAKWGRGILALVIMAAAIMTALPARADVDPIPGKDPRLGGDAEGPVTGVQDPFAVVVIVAG